MLERVISLPQGSLEDHLTIQERIFDNNLVCIPRRPMCDQAHTSPDRCRYWNCRQEIGPADLSFLLSPALYAIENLCSRVLIRVNARLIVVFLAVLMDFV